MDSVYMMIRHKKLLLPSHIDEIAIDRIMGKIILVEYVDIRLKGGKSFLFVATASVSV
jgi:hypothetical protein